MSKKFDMFINGYAHNPASQSYFDSIDLASGEVFARVAKGSAPDVEEAVQIASSAQSEWAKLKP